MCCGIPKCGDQCVVNEALQAQLGDDREKGCQPGSEEVTSTW